MTSLTVTWREVELISCVAICWWAMSKFWLKS